MDKMIHKIINQELCLNDGTRIIIDVDIPVEQDVVESEKEEEFIKGIITDQVLNGLRDGIEAYKMSKLPNKFLHPQAFIITNKLPFTMLGAFCLIGDDILVDADAISNIGRTNSCFLLGHEMGHKIRTYVDYKEAYNSIAQAFGINVMEYEGFLNEMYANICGLIVKGSNDEQLPHLMYQSLNEVLSEDHCEHLKRIVLKSMYHV